MTSATGLPRTRGRFRRALPALVLASLAIGAIFLLTRTVWLQGIYIATVRDMYFDCIQASDQNYLFRMTTGPCRLRNLEYDSLMTHDKEGFRISRAPTSDEHSATTTAPRVVVLGDSHAYGHGVNDDQTFAALLSVHLGEPVRNLALPATATQRELEALGAHARDAKFLVLQYCDNDFGENRASLEMGLQRYRETLRTRMDEVFRNYEHTQQQGLFTRALMTASYGLLDLVRSRLWRLTSVDGDERTLADEAEAFARVIEGSAPLLKGKTIVVLESSGWGRNRRNFQSVFARRLSRLPQMHWVVLDSATLLDRDDYFRLDDHINASGHRKLAAALDRALKPRLVPPDHPAPAE